MISVGGMPEGFWYRLTRSWVRFVHHECVRAAVVHPDRWPVRGPLLLAVTHLSHLEPFFVSLRVRQPIHWMGRLEFFRLRPIRWMLKRHLVFPVNRQGLALGALRRAIVLLDAGRIVGIFPEGGVQHGGSAAIRGGPIKLGVCFLAQHTQTPIVPIVICGTDKLNRVPPWLPRRRARVWIAIGEPIAPPAFDKRLRREQRRDLGVRLSGAFQSLYRELVEQTDLDPATVP